MELYRQGIAERPCIIFDPTQIDGPSYDPFWWLLKDGEESLALNVWNIVQAIIPISPNDMQPFWVETEQSVFAAILIYGFRCGLSFSETITMCVTLQLSKLCSEILESGNVLASCFLGEICKLKQETLANVDRGLRNKLIKFAADPYISHAFRGEREGAVCFTWEDLKESNIFLLIQADKIEQWGGALNLMYAQLIRHLERRPEQYSVEGADNIQTLILMDEFARFGKLEGITSAMATLRSKKVNFCLMIQSMAQLDHIYGEHERRTIFDNCHYQAILRANDAGTQKYLSELIGTAKGIQKGVSKTLNRFGDTDGYSQQATEMCDWQVPPHMLATLQDVLLLSPYGFNRIDKHLPCNDLVRHVLSAPSSRYWPAEFVSLDAPTGLPINQVNLYEGAAMLSMEERAQNADKKVRAHQHQQRLERRQTDEKRRKREQRRNFVIGELVVRYFPEAANFKPEVSHEQAVQIQPLEAFLIALAADRELVELLKKRACHRQQSGAIVEPGDLNCVSDPQTETILEG